MNGDAESTEVTVSGSMMDSLRSTRPWARFLAILGFVWCGLMVLLGIGFMIFANLFAHQKSGPPLLFGLVYILMSLLYFFPARYLFKFSSSLGNFLSGNQATDLESALAHQKSFWKFSGVVALIGICLGVLGIAAAIIIPILTRMSMQ
jgi:hypothetical protein